MQEICPNCWMRYPAGTDYCKSCRLPIPVAVHMPQIREVQEYKVKRPAIVRTAGWFLFLRLLLTLVPAVVGYRSPDAALWLFGPVYGPRLTEVATAHPGVAGEVIGGMVVGGLLAWGVLALMVRAFFGRVIVFGIVFLSAFAQVVILKVDLAIPANDLGLLGSFLCCAVLGYSIVKPQ